MEPLFKTAWTNAKSYAALENWVTSLPEYRQTHANWKKRLSVNGLIPFKKGTFKDYFKKYLRGNGSSLVRILDYDFVPIFTRQIKRAWIRKPPSKKFDLQKPALPPFPNKLTLEIDCRRNKDDIVDEIEGILTMLRTEYGMPQNRRQGNGLIDFKVLTLMQLGVKNSKDIQKRLMAEYKRKEKRTPEKLDAHRKTINRAISKYKSAA